MRNRLQIVRLILAIMLGLIFANCGSLFRSGKGEQSKEIYELAWIHPQVLLSDPKFTLITAERVDSFVVPKVDRSGKSSPSVVFEIFRPGCQASITLAEHYGSTLGPLLTQTFAPGWYKFTLHGRMFSAEELPPGQYILEVITCDSEARSVFFRE